MADAQAYQEPAEEVVEQAAPDTEVSEPAYAEPEAAEETEAEPAQEGTEEPGRGKPDLSEALRQERAKRRLLEQQLAASKGGLDPALVDSLVQRSLQAKQDQAAAAAVLPELKKDVEMQKMVTSLMFDENDVQVATAEQAAKKLAKMLGRVKEEASAEALSAKSEAERAREAATTTPGSSKPNGASVENDRLQELRRSPDRAVRQKAILEQLKQRIR